MIIVSDNYIAKIIGLGVLQSSILIFYIALAKVYGGRVPIDTGAIGAVYSSPVPHVLMLTAIVVGFGLMLVALALALMIYKQFGSLKVSELVRYDDIN